MFVSAAQAGCHERKIAGARSDVEIQKTGFNWEGLAADGSDLAWTTFCSIWNKRLSSQLFDLIRTLPVLLSTIRLTYGSHEQNSSQSFPACGNRIV